MDQKILIEVADATSKASEASSKLTAASGAISTAFKLGNLAAYVKGIKSITESLTKCIKVSSDYIENLNLMSVAFGNTADSAQEYIEKVSGAFGLDESTLTKQLGIFRQIGSALNIDSESADKLAKNLTGLQLDMSSLFNLDFERAGEILQSAMAGQTKGIRAATGADITEATLQLDLYRLGVNKTVSELNRSEKVLLIYQSLTRQLSNANGDLAKTINAPSNQMRIFKEQCSRLARAIGNLVLPAFAAVIPYINAFLMVIVKAISALATLLGFDAKEWAGGFSTGADSVSTGFDDMAEAADNAASSANKAKLSLRGFDKLNNITTPTSSGSGSGGGSTGIDPALLKGLKEYDLNLDKIKNKAEIIADKIWDWITGEKEFSSRLDLLNPVFDDIIKSSISIKNNLFEIATDPNVVNAANSMLKSWKTAFSDLVANAVIVGTNLADGIIGGFSQFIENHKDSIKEDLTRIFKIEGEWFDFGDEIFNALGDISFVFTKDNFKGITESIFEIFYEIGTNSFAIAQQIGLDFLEGLIEPFTSNSDLIAEALDKTFEPVSILLDGIAKSITDTFDVFWEVYNDSIKPAFDKTKEAATKLINTFLNLYNKYIAPILTSVATKLSDLWTTYVQPIVGSIIEIVGNIILVIQTMWERYLVPIIEWIAGTIIPILSPIVKFILDTVITAVKAILAPIKAVISILSGLITFLTGVFTGDWDKAWKGIMKIVESVKNFFKDTINLIVEKFENIIDFIGGLITGFFDSLKNGVLVIANFISDKIDRITGFFSGAAKTIKKVFSEIPGAIKGFFTSLPEFFSGLWTRIKDKLSSWGTKIGEAVGGAFKTVINAVLSTVEKVINMPIKAINKLIGVINKVLPEAKELNKLDTFSLPRLAKGGFPDKGQMFIAREAGPELVGTMGNENVVANNGQIIEGIRQAAKDGFLDAMQLTGGQNVSVSINAEGDSSGLLNFIKFEEKKQNRQFGL